MQTGETRNDLPVASVVAFCPLEATFTEGPSARETADALGALEQSQRWTTSRTEDHLPVIYTSRQEALVNLMNSFPRALLVCDLDPDALGGLGLHQDHLDRMRHPMDGLVLSQARVSIWNVGTVLVRLTFEVSDQPKDEAWLADSVAAIKSLENSIQRLAAVLTDWKSAHFGALWVTPFYICAASPSADSVDRHAIAATIAANGVDVVMEDYAGTVARFARFSCIVTSDPQSSAVSMTLGLLAVHHVCWSAALALDGSLNEELASVNLAHRVMPETLERQASRVLEKYLQVRRFRLCYNSVEPHLDHAAARLWKGIENGWQFERVLQTLDERLDFVSTLHGQLHARLQDGRARLLNEIVLIFTFFNLFSFAIAALTFAQVPSVVAKIAPIIAMCLLLGVNVAAYYWFRRRYNSGSSDPGPGAVSAFDITHGGRR